MFPQLKPHKCLLLWRCKQGPEKMQRDVKRAQKFPVDAESAKARAATDRRNDCILWRFIFVMPLMHAMSVRQDFAARFQSVEVGSHKFDTANSKPVLRIERLSVCMYFQPRLTVFSHRLSA